MKTLLVANRGEIAVRIMHAAAELGIRTIAVFSEDDADSLHVRRADASSLLRGQGPAAYLDVEQLLAVAAAEACDAIHPGYGFLSENEDLARRAEAAGVTFVGPRAETLATFGDKVQARALAAACGVPVLPGTVAVDLAQAGEFLAQLGPGVGLMIKAVAGGGGRGMRLVRSPAELAEGFERCQSEALRAFGNRAIYVEQHMPRARHIEVQILGDGSGAVSHLGERDCSIQRRYQKLIEIAPCPMLSAGLRARITAAAVGMAATVRFLNAGTFEFLVDAQAIEPANRDGAPARGDSSGVAEGFVFIEANPRLQVEHTVTEEVLGLDIVRLQLQLAAGASLADLGLSQEQVPAPRGFAIQVRVNAETIGADGNPRPSSGALLGFELPSGHGVRTDTCGYVGYPINPRFDSLLAKLIGHSTSPRFADAVARTLRALRELKIEGVRTNVSLLRRVLEHPDFVANRVHTRFVEEHIVDLVDASDTWNEPVPSPGARIDNRDPLAVLAYGKSPSGVPPATLAAASPDMSEGGPAAADGMLVVAAPMQGTIVSLTVRDGDAVRRGQSLLVMNAMKMEHVLEAPAAGIVRRLVASAGDTVAEGQALMCIEVRDEQGTDTAESAPVDLDHIRADLAEVRQRHAVTLDEARPEAVERRRRIGQRTARENIGELCDAGSFVEYGGLAIAAQRQRRSVEDLIQRTPADGLVSGIGRVNGELFNDRRAQCAVLSYDYTVLAGTQGFLNHRKKDRLFDLIGRLRLPTVFFTEGGGGRPGDTDAPGVAGLDCMAFHLFGKLSGLVPLVGINAGRCFAGNAALLGCCDVIIATASSNIGMGGPAMIEGGGLGVFRPEEVGPLAVQVPNGVVDIAVEDEAEAVRVAKQYLSYFQGAVAEWQCADQRLLRTIIPEQRLRVYDVRRVIEAMADAGSVLEIRRQFGAGMVTAMVRFEGRPVGVIANNPKHLSGAIDSPAADKAVRFMQLCDAFDIPILSLCDTPGIMVGPEVEKTALVRHACRMFVVGASLTVPYFTIVLRKGYGLGAQAMAGGSFRAPVFTVAWPTGEFGGMGLEGAVKLGFRKELEAVEDPHERQKLFDHMVARAYEHGKGLNMAAHLEIDDVIDPAESRRWILNALRSAPPPAPRSHKKRPCVDTW